MERKIKVAITGGIGSGKSTVCEWIAELGHPVFSCDTIYKQLYPTEEFQRELRLAFPACVKDGIVDKTLLTKTVFSDNLALEKLNRLSHPRIMARLYAEMEKVNAPISFAEVPLLFEEGLDNAFDYVIVVLRNLEDRIAAVIERDGADRSAVLARIQNQWDYDLPQNRARLQEAKFFIIENRTNIQELRIEVQDILFWLLKEVKQLP